MNNEYKEPEFRGLLIALSALISSHDLDDIPNLIWLINKNYASKDMVKKDVIVQQAKRISDRYLAYMESQNA